MGKRALLALAGVVLAAWLLPNTSAFAAEKITLCYVSNDASYGPWFYAKEKGFFEKHGLDTSIVFIESGTKGAQAVVGGAVDICATDGAAVVNARLAGVEIRFIAVTLGVLQGKVLAAKDITKPEQLKGKKWGISAFGSEAQIAQQVFLKKYGIAESEITTLQLGNTGNRFAALEAGQIQVSTFQLPLMAKVEAAGYTVLANLVDLAPDYFSIGPTVTVATLQKRRPMLKNFLMALSESTAAYKKDRDGGIETIKKYLKASDADAATAWEYFAPLNPVNLRPTPASVQFYLDHSPDPKAKTMKPEDVYDLSLLDELDKSGFFKTAN